jgi:hypothetical protein
MGSAALAGVRPGLDTWVAAVGDDNYVATVTPAEQFADGRPLRWGHPRHGERGVAVLPGSAMAKLA